MGTGWDRVPDHQSGSLLVHLWDQPHFPHPSVLQAPLSTSTGIWQLTGDELGGVLVGPDPAHGFPRPSLDQGHSSFCCTDNTQWAVSHTTCPLFTGEKRQTGKGKNTYGHSQPNTCFVWSEIVPKKDVALGQKASAQPQDTLKAQL